MTASLFPPGHPGKISPRQTRVAPSTEIQKRIHLNVGGARHSPYVSTLRNIPDSPLAWIIRDDCKAELDYDSSTQIYFFDRHPGIFTHILNYFQTGKLHCPRDVCGPMFEAELNFWGIDETQMEACCWGNYTAHREIQENLKLFEFTQKESPREKGETFYNSATQELTAWEKKQLMIWEILDEPHSSSVAKIVSYISLGFILLSIVVYSLLTMYNYCDCKMEIRNLTKNSTNGCTLISSAVTENRSSETHLSDLSFRVFSGFEILFAFWFTLEIMMRFTFCPKKLNYVFTFSNWVDFLAVIPVYLLIFFSCESTLMILNMVRYVRVFRFFKLLTDLHILGRTLKASFHQLFILILILCVPAVIFSSFVHYSETHWGGEKSKEAFTDIPKSMWWCIITMCTIGYGRAVPESGAGKVVGTLAAIVGILLVSMTASILGSSFQQYYNVARTQLKIPSKMNNSFVKKKESLREKLSFITEASSIPSLYSRDSGYEHSPAAVRNCNTSQSMSPAIKMKGDNNITNGW